MIYHVPELLLLVSEAAAATGDLHLLREVSCTSGTFDRPLYFDILVSLHSKNSNEGCSKVLMAFKTIALLGDSESGSASSETSAESPPSTYRIPSLPKFGWMLATRLNSEIATVISSLFVQLALMNSHEEALELLRRPEFAIAKHCAWLMYCVFQNFPRSITRGSDYLSAALREFGGLESIPVGSQSGHYAFEYLLKAYIWLNDSEALKTVLDYLLDRRRKSSAISNNCRGDLWGAMLDAATCLRDEDRGNEIIKLAPERSLGVEGQINFWAAIGKFQNMFRAIQNAETSRESCFKFDGYHMVMKQLLHHYPGDDKDKEEQRRQWQQYVKQLIDHITVKRKESAGDRCFTIVTYLLARRNLQEAVNFARIENPFHGDLFSCWLLLIQICAERSDWTNFNVCLHMMQQPPHGRGTFSRPSLSLTQTQIQCRAAGKEDELSRLQKMIVSYGGKLHDLPATAEEAQEKLNNSSVQSSQMINQKTGCE